MQMVNVAHAQHLKAPGVRQLNLEDIAMNKSSAPTSLEKRVVTVLTGNGNLPSAAELQELISDTELSVQSNLAGAEAARVESLDLVQCRDPSEANQRIATAKLTADRLSTSLPKLHDKLSEALAAEQCDRWWNDYKHVKEKLDAAVEAHKEYPNLVQAIADIFTLAAEVDREVSRLNGSAPPGVDRRLRGVELTARGMMAFSRENPSLASVTVLPNYEQSARTLWPTRSSGAMAAEFSQGMVMAPHPGANWSRPEVQAQKREEIDRNQKHQADWYSAASADQEDRLNRDEALRFAALHPNRR
jgi:hypothetical protein